MLRITDREFNQMSSYIKANYGIHLKKEKQTLLTGRLHNVLQHLGFNNFTDYYNYVVADKSGDAVANLINKVTTNHTFFMREEDHFHYFRDVVIPYLIRNVREKDLRIWSAACSSGEEPYTLAMILDEYFGKEKNLWDTKILATDISTKVLDMGMRGVYSRERIAPLPSIWRKNYLMEYMSDNYMITDKIKKEVIFRKLNLTDDTFPFRKKFHVIFCRNVMIYFDNDTKNELLNKFYDLLESGGYLFIGHSESINRESSKFKYIRPSIYRKE